MLTVIGIIGKTQGVTSEIRPHSAAVMRNAPSPVLWSGTSTGSRRESTSLSPALYSSIGLATFNAVAVGGSAADLGEPGEVSPPELPAGRRVTFGNGGVSAFSTSAANRAS